jgi:16S rRNA (adenine1518-N6/adenine1519-N6)-dimethyltransferase
MKLSEIRKLLAERQIQLTKSLGQNFLHDSNQLRRIVEAAELGPADKVLEIGPGLGPLTERLLACAGEVLAIEKDLRLIGVLNDRFGSPIHHSTTPFRLVHADALEWLRTEPRDWSGWKLVSNLPYSVASPILVELAQAHHPPDRLVATLQLEVARRLVAKAGEPDYGILTLLVQLQFEPHGWFKIPAGCFFPEPDVDSACVSLVRRPQPLLLGSERALFARLVKRSFSQRRKVMLKLLKTDRGWDGFATRHPRLSLDRLFAELQIPAQARAETLDLEHFVRLTQRLAADSSCV